MNRYDEKSQFFFLPTDAHSHIWTIAHESRTPLSSEAGTPPMPAIDDFVAVLATAHSLKIL
jgi:hypothetical protein